MEDSNHRQVNQQHLALLRQQEALVQVQDLERQRLHQQPPQLGPAHQPQIRLQDPPK